MKQKRFEKNQVPGANAKGIIQILSTLASSKTYSHIVRERVKEHQETLRQLLGKTNEVDNFFLSILVAPEENGETKGTLFPPVRYVKNPLTVDTTKWTSELFEEWLKNDPKPEGPNKPLFRDIIDERRKEYIKKQ